jgi:beta-phosphoglucomutase-like phosphatase (HAD superfamily)
MRPDSAVNLLGAAGLADWQGHIEALPEGERYLPSKDTWLRVAAGVGAVPAGCVAVCTSGESAKNALSAGMRCVAIPDQHTDHHDFSGADMVVESLDDEVVKRVLSLLEPGRVSA